jgi:hypothetical protein
MNTAAVSAIAAIGQKVLAVLQGEVITALPLLAGLGVDVATLTTDANKLFVDLQAFLAKLGDTAVAAASAKPPTA